VDKVPSEIDKRFNIFFPVEACESNIFALSQDPDDIRLKAPIPTKNLIEDYIRISLEYYYKEGVGNEIKYRLLDVDGKEITPSELAEKYFSSPEDCFIKADETLRAEERASICNNLLYSQNIRHKIIPHACNNIVSRFHNNHIEDNGGRDIYERNTTAIVVYKYPLKREP
jgi:hypothetical protein